MRNPIKELKGIKDSINEVKQTMDGIKGTLDDVKGDVDQVQKRLQTTMDHAKQTSEKAQNSTQQLKQSLQKANTGMTQSKKHIASTKKDIQQGVSIVKGLFGAVTERRTAEEANVDTHAAPSNHTQHGYTDVDRAADQQHAGAQLIEGGQLYQEGTAFFLKKDDQVIGEITYIPGPFHDTWTLNHTYVNPEFRGGKIAKGLLDQVVNAARAENKKIIPACSYAAVQFKRDSSYNDVWWKE
ncbi:GNAT family N-acetyltransferase [Paenibacillus kandeliae]|uniref:GNAT family N-acetyltransferase n=1 Tax=Paenibacillus kandeliae TaxID=3231269 RepID=UPI00345A92C5